ncbi:hypothetical protein AUP68_04519 [Ilyonectria robusta]
MNTLISRLTVWRTRIVSLQNNLVEAPSDSDSGSGSGLGSSGGSPENNEPPLDLKASVDGLSGSGDASGKDSSFDTGNGTGTGFDSDADDNEDLIHLAPGVGSKNLFEIAAGAGDGSDGIKTPDLLDLVESVGGAENLIALITNPDSDSDGDGTSSIYELLKAAGGAENLFHMVEGLGGDMDGLSQLVDQSEDRRNCSISSRTWAMKTGPISMLIWTMKA